MSVTVCSDDSYVIVIDNGASGGRALRVKWGSGAAEVWTLEQDGTLTLTGDLIFKGPAEINARVTSANVLEVADVSGVLVSLYCRTTYVDPSYYEYGQWLCANTGIALKKLSACPGGGAANGTTQTLHATGPTLYALVGRVDGGWRKVTLT